MLKQWEIHCYTRFLGVPWWIPWKRSSKVSLWELCVLWLPWVARCHMRRVDTGWVGVRAPGLFLEGRNLASDLESFEMLRESTGWVGNFGMIGDDLGMFKKVRRCRSFFEISQLSTFPEGHRYVLRGQSATSRTANGMLPLNGSDCPIDFFFQVQPIATHCNPLQPCLLHALSNLINERHQQKGVGEKIRSLMYWIFSLEQSSDL